MNPHTESRIKKSHNKLDRVNHIGGKLNTIDRSTLIRDLKRQAKKLQYKLGYTPTYPLSMLLPYLKIDYAELKPKKCKYCGNEYTPSKINRKYCSENCRSVGMYIMGKMAYRQRDGSKARLRYDTGKKLYLNAMKGGKDK